MPLNLRSHPLVEHKLPKDFSVCENFWCGESKVSTQIINSVPEIHLRETTMAYNKQWFCGDGHLQFQNEVSGIDLLHLQK